jgi:hypothetical protein
MNSIRCLAIIVFLSGVVCQAAPPIANLLPVPPPPPVTKEDTKKSSNSLQIVTCEGTFTLDTISGAVKINDSDVPTTVKLNGTITKLSKEKGRLQLFLGRTVPYVTGSYPVPNGTKSYSQLSVGLQSNFMVTFGKPLTIQTDDNGTVSILVKREEE